jgi:hypothetical protein
VVTESSRGQVGQVIDEDDEIQTLIASVQLALFSALPASITMETGLPSAFMEWIVKVFSIFLENKNEEDEGDLVNFGISSTSSKQQFVHSIVVEGVIRHSPFRVNYNGHESGGERERKDFICF